jgi:hypothetical protein
MPTGVSEATAASIIRVMMETTSTSESQLNSYQTTLRNNPESVYIRYEAEGNFLQLFFFVQNLFQTNLTSTT